MVHGARTGFSVIELLCVLIVASILVSLLGYAVTNGYRKSRAVAIETGSAAIRDYLLEGCHAYCANHPAYQFASAQDFTDKCVRDGRVRNWMGSPLTTFTPFNSTWAGSNVVLTVTIPTGYRNGSVFYWFTKSALSGEEDR